MKKILPVVYVFLTACLICSCGTSASKGPTDETIKEHIRQWHEKPKEKVWFDFQIKSIERGAPLKNEGLFGAEPNSAIVYPVTIIFIDRSRSWCSLKLNNETIRDEAFFVKEAGKDNSWVSKAKGAKVGEDESLVRVLDAPKDNVSGFETNHIVLLEALLDPERFEIQLSLKDGENNIATLEKLVASRFAKANSNWEKTDFNSIMERKKIAELNDAIEQLLNASRGSLALRDQKVSVFNIFSGPSEKSLADEVMRNITSRRGFLGF